MIIYPQAFLTSAVVSLEHARIGYQTWLRDLDPSALTASSTASGAAADAVLRPDTYEYWEPTSLPATLTIALGAARAVDYIGIAAHTLGSCGVSIKAEYSTDGLSYSTFSSELLPADDRPIMFLDDEVTASYLRLTLTGSGSMPRIAVVYAGVALAMQRAIYGGHTPITLSRDTELVQELSKGGQFLGQTFVRRGVSTSVSFKYLTASWYRENFDPFVKAARKYPYFFAWRPATFPLEVGYVWTPRDIKPSNMGKRDFMEVGWAMHGVGYD